ncbi:unnamed protein product [Prunus armeniaca]
MSSSLLLLPYSNARRPTSTSNTCMSFWPKNCDKLLIKFDTHVEVAKASKHEIAANAYKLAYLDCRNGVFPCCLIENEDAELLYLDVPLFKVSRSMSWM